ncbi:hypothetical protein GCM10023324_34350 [Streptomyces youssoufiensis]
MHTRPIGADFACVMCPPVLGGKAPEPVAGPGRAGAGPRRVFRRGRRAPEAWHVSWWGGGCRAWRAGRWPGAGRPARPGRWSGAAYCAAAGTDQPSVRARAGLPDAGAVPMLTLVAAEGWQSYGAAMNKALIGAKGERRLGITMEIRPGPMP